MENREHNFIQHSAGGDTLKTSWSFQKCRKCGECFTHKYNIESYEEAQKREKINEKCEPNLK